MKESQVQQILKRWFQTQGYIVSENMHMPGGNKLDLVAKSTVDEWFVEVKGDYDMGTEQYGINFDTGMGQLIKSITQRDENKKFGIGIPFSRTEKGEKLSYRLILPKYAKTIIFEVLNIHLLLVRDDNSVEIINPGTVRYFLSQIESAIR